MIEYIEFFEEPNTYYRYSKENMADFITNIYPSYFYNSISKVEWIYENKIVNFSDKLVKHLPLKNWKGIAFIIDEETLIICNSDGNVRFKIEVPANLIQLSSYKFNEKLEAEINDEYQIGFARFDGYFYYEGKNYISVKVEKYHKRNWQDALTQMRYIDTETGLFLNFTKKISTRLPDQWSYRQEYFDI